MRVTERNSTPGATPRLPIIRSKLAGGRGAQIIYFGGARGTSRRCTPGRSRRTIRLGWEQVGRADWDEQRHVLILSGLTPAAPTRTVLHLARDWDLLAVAAERISWTSVIDQRISLNGQAGARVVVRHVPGGARVRWLVIPGRGLDPGNPVVRAELESALTELRAATGLEDPEGSEPGISPPW